MAYRLRVSTPHKGASMRNIILAAGLAMLLGTRWNVGQAETD
jgi:hypothetical protein